MHSAYKCNLPLLPSILLVTYVLSSSLFLVLSLTFPLSLITPFLKNTFRSSSNFCPLTFPRMPPPIVTHPLILRSSFILTHPLTVICSLTPLTLTLRPSFTLLPSFTLRPSLHTLILLLPLCFHFHSHFDHTLPLSLCSHIFILTLLPSFQSHCIPLFSKYWQQTNAEISQAVLPCECLFNNSSCWLYWYMYTVLYTILYIIQYGYKT